MPSETVVYGALALAGAEAVGVTNFTSYGSGGDGEGPDGGPAGVGSGLVQALNAQRQDVNALRGQVSNLGNALSGMPSGIPQAPDLSLEAPEAPSINMPDITMPEINIPETPTPQTTTPEVLDPSTYGGFGQYMQNQGGNVRDLANEGSTPGDWVAATANAATEAGNVAGEAGEFVSQNPLAVGGTALGVGLAPFTGGSSLVPIAAGAGLGSASEIAVDNAGKAADMAGDIAFERGEGDDIDLPGPSINDVAQGVADTISNVGGNGDGGDGESSQERSGDSETQGNKNFAGLPVKDNSPIDKVRTITPGGPGSNGGSGNGDSSSGPTGNARPGPSKEQVSKDEPRASGRTSVEDKKEQILRLSP